ncbi:MAG: substrate-binding domain-containing protein [Kineosporiaceae bacterium]|jgi:Ca-activated chloride channel family protein
MSWSWFGNDRTDADNADGVTAEASPASDAWWQLTPPEGEALPRSQTPTPTVTPPPSPRADAVSDDDPGPPVEHEVATAASPSPFAPDGSRAAVRPGPEEGGLPPATMAPGPPPRSSGDVRSRGHASTTASRGRRRLLFSGLALVLTVAALVAGYAVLPGAIGGAASTCSEPVPVVVAVTSDVTDVVAAAATSFGRRQPGAGDTCYAVRTVPVTSTDSGAQPSGASEAAAVIAGPSIVPAPPPGGDAATAQLGRPVRLASTLAVVALPAPMADALGWSGERPTWAQVSTTLLTPTAWRTAGRPEYGDFTIALVEPTASSASAAGLVAIAAAAAGKDVPSLEPTDLASERVQGSLLSLSRQVTRRAADPEELVQSLLSADRAGTLLQTTSAVITDERTVLSYNRSSPRTPLVAVYPDDGVVGVDLTFTPVVGALGSSTRRGATEFRDFLTGDAGQEVLTRQGYRGLRSGTSPELTVARGLTPDAQTRAVTGPRPDIVAGATAGWQRLQNPGRFLVLMDVSGSMKETVPGTGRTKLQFAQDAAVRGMKLVPPEAEIGLWEFSTALNRSQDYRELVPLGGVGDQLDGQPRLESLTGAVRGLTPREDTGLYDSALAAFRAVRKTYSPGEPNIVVLLTDGRNDDAGSVTLPGLVATLRAEQDDKRPVRFLTIAYGADADTAALTQIADATDGSAYTAPNPADIDSVFFRALTSP